MTLSERLGLPLLRTLDPERAHGLALAALRAGLGPRPPPGDDPAPRHNPRRPRSPHPIGLAAGFDKNAPPSPP